MRCPDCNKFVSLELADPEINSLEISQPEPKSEDAPQVTLTARIVRTCTECGTELKEASFNMKADAPAEVVKHLKEPGKHELEIIEDSAEGTEEGGGRYSKNYFGVSVEYTVRCNCGDFECSGSIAAQIAASVMDELV